VAEDAARTSCSVSSVASIRLATPDTDRLGPSANRLVWKKTCIWWASMPCRRSFSPARVA